MSEITETIILDANQKFSSEYLGGNKSSPSLFTNKMGHGVQVKAGDQVSIYNSFISEIGSTSDSIEFNNDFLEKRTITTTTMTPALPVWDDNDKPLGYQRISASNTTSEYDVRQNKVKISINYYKNANGENYFQLPRRFLTKNASDASKSWEGTDEEAQGQTFLDGVLYTSEYKNYNNNVLQFFICSEDTFYFVSPTAAAYPDSQFTRFKMQNDNSRYKIFVNVDTRYGLQSDNSSLTQLLATDRQTAADYEYIEYIENIELEIDVGFNSPSTIADKLTEILRKQEEPQINTYRDNASAAVSHLYGGDIPMSLELNSNTYKTFWSSGLRISDESTWAGWNRQAILNVDDAQSNDYLSQFQYIGVKRPDLFIAGRNFARFFKPANGHLTQGLISMVAEMPSGAGAGYEYSLWEDNFKGLANTGNLNASGQPYHQIVFNLLWYNASSQTKMDLLKGIFDTQANYPELFRNEFNQMGANYQYTTVNNSRFIHMNQKTYDYRTTYINHLCLGWDYQAQNSGPSRSPERTESLASQPLFIDFQPEYKDNENGGDSWETGYKYGVFKKFDYNGSSYVSVTTGKMLDSVGAVPDADFTSIPNPYFDLNNASYGKIDSGTWFGWDVNFNAFGNNIIGLTDGYLRNNFNKTSFNEMNPLFLNASSIRTYKYVNKIYLGADQPQIEYNNITQRFQISNLHTGERVQNRYNANSNASTSVEIKEFATQGDIVYKINKRLMNNNFTPNMMPYLMNEFIPQTVSGINYDLFQLNPNLKAWTIYDQLSGIVIKDFGVSDTHWENSIWGILGFTYSQFNSILTSSNDLNSRVGNSNKNSLPFAFTNANVNSQQTLDFPTNAFGSAKYTQQIPITQEFNGTYPSSASWGWPSFRTQVYPAITETAESIILSAPNLPRRIRDGFYCIRSDILSSTNYIGGPDSGWLYPILQVVDKVNDTADFWVGGEGTIVYTFTQDRTITEITTQITNPDQKLATINSGSSIMYKLIRFRPNNFDIISQVLNEKK